jgi:signal transduction histidine kinase
VRAKGGALWAGPTPYRGKDRRASPDWHETSLGPFIAAGAGLLVVIVVFGLGPQAGAATDLVNVSVFRLQMDAAAVAVATIAGVLCMTRWRVTGEAAALWLGLALLLFGAATIGLGAPLPGTRPIALDSEIVALAHPATRITVLWLLWRAFRTPEVDAGLRLWRALLAAVGVTAVVTVVFQLLPGLLPFLASTGDLLGDRAGIAAPGTVLLVVAWVSLGAAFGFRGIRKRHWLFAWVGLTFFALAFAELMKIAAHPAGSFWLAGPNVLRTIGIIFAVIGATRELVRAFEEQRVRLLETVESDRSKDARLEAEQRAFEEMAHEARNALSAIEGATKTLERYRDRLDDDTRQSLTHAVSQEIARLQTLVSRERVRSTAGQFRLVDVVAAVVTAARSHGVTVHVDVPDHFIAFGQPAETGQVVQNLVANARRYAPDSPIHLRAESTRTGVLLRVEDEGPGVPADERTAIFERGHRGSTAGGTVGTGLGLYVSARLMREQGGDLWAEERPGGGASFAMWLPSEARSAQVVEEVGDELEHPAEGAQVTPLFGIRPPQDARGRLPSGAGDDDDHVGNHATR